eukprot:1393615-Amorphochlora_amoeboformis.AAC.3
MGGYVTVGKSELEKKGKVTHLRPVPASAFATRMREDVRVAIGEAPPAMFGAEYARRNTATSTRLRARLKDVTYFLIEN